MTHNFILRAQALDNTSPDPCSYYGEYLEPDDSVRRRDAACKLSAISESGKVFFQNSGVQLTATDREFLVEIRSIERDRVGRIAPIGCYGTIDLSKDEPDSSAVLDALGSFARDIGRTLEPSHLEMVRNAVDEFKKKNNAETISRFF